MLYQIKIPLSWQAILHSSKQLQEVSRNFCSIPFDQCPVSRWPRSRLLATSDDLVAICELLCICWANCLNRSTNEAQIMFNQITQNEINFQKSSNLNPDITTAMGAQYSALLKSFLFLLRSHYDALASVIGELVEKNSRSKVQSMSQIKNDNSLIAKFINKEVPEFKVVFFKMKKLRDTLKLGYITGTSLINAFEKTDLLIDIYKVTEKREAPINETTQQVSLSDAEEGLVMSVKLIKAVETLMRSKIDKH